MTDLFLFRNDLRVADNPGLAAQLSGSISNQQASWNFTCYCPAAAREWINAITSSRSLSDGRLVDIIFIWRP